MENNLENFSIPPELFYSKNSSDSKKHKISNIVPQVIKKKFKIVKNFVSGKRQSFKRHSKKNVSPNRPQLGTINKNYLKVLKARKVAQQKKAKAEKPKAKLVNIPTKISLNDSRNESTVTLMSTLDDPPARETSALQDLSNISVKPITIPRPVKPSLIQIETCVDDDDESGTRFWEEDSKKRKKSGSFKFFKSKNTRSGGEGEFFPL
jgi:hypothetical protein